MTATATRVTLIDLIVRLLAGSGGPVAAIKVADECLRDIQPYTMIP